MRKSEKSSREWWYHSTSTKHGSQTVACPNSSGKTKFIYPEETVSPNTVSYLFLEDNEEILCSNLILYDFYLPYISHCLGSAVA